jgi:RNA-directed DNA polymerase
MAKLGLALNETKTSVRNARQEHFGFLGYSVLQRHGKGVHNELRTMS